MPKAMLQLGSAGLIALVGLGGQSKAAPLPACPAAVQTQADRALANLEQRQQQQDTELRSHPTASYATMNGPVLRELEKRQQREALEASLQRQANQRHHCLLVLP